ncbi:MAG: choice-of-anchor L domain-containing protein, partial [Propionibacteriaceae bacterium]|nr:choice-of-anchor L domain-containing protein [Propionibacteriaceae bacterium]
MTTSLTHHNFAGRPPSRKLDVILDRVRTNLKTPARRRGLSALASVVVLALIGMVSFISAPHALAAPGQTVVNLTSGLTAQDLVAKLIGDGTPFSNAKFSGDPKQLGTFAGFDTLGAAEGVVMSTGLVDSSSDSAVPGPNLSDSTNGMMGGIGTDKDLAPLAGSADLYDVVTLEFDFVPATEEVKFDYIFASEEYKRFVGGNFNDVFGLFVNGKNCATVGNNEVVSVNTINNGNDTGTVSPKNPGLYRDNPVGSETPIDTGFNGITTVLTCKTAVNKGETNKIKFAIADVADDLRDSGVFIVANSFKTDYPVAEDDYATTSSDQSVTIPVLDNDTGNGLVLKEIATQPANGTAVVQGDQVVYTPKPGYVGTDSFTYTIENENGITATGTVTVQVTASLLDVSQSTFSVAPTSSKGAGEIPVANGDAA